MPCHIAYHDSDTYFYRVENARREVPRMLWMIRRICGVMGVYSYMQASPLYDELNELMKGDPKLRLVRTVGLSNTVSDPEAK